MWIQSTEIFFCFQPLQVFAWTNFILLQICQCSLDIKYWIKNYDLKPRKKAKECKKVSTAKENISVLSSSSSVFLLANFLQDISLLLQIFFFCSFVQQEVFLNKHFFELQKLLFILQKNVLNNNFFAASLAIIIFFLCCASLWGKWVRENGAGKQIGIVRLETLAATNTLNYSCIVFMTLRTDGSFWLLFKLYGRGCKFYKFTSLLWDCGWRM